MKAMFAVAVMLTAMFIAEAEAVELFNGRDLNGWYKYLKGYGRDNDPQNVISVTNGVIRITGETWGALVTEREYSNYRLDVEYRWTGKKFPSKAKAALDSGILFHSTGPDGGFAGIWMFSHELNVIYGATGDIWTVGSKKARPDMFVKSTAHRMTDGLRTTLVYDPHGEEVTLTGNERLARLDIDPSWTDSPEAKAADNENPIGEWNKVTLICRGDKVECRFNGRIVNRATVSPARGKIQLQSEGCEIEYRHVTLTPISLPERAFNELPKREIKDLASYVDPFVGTVGAGHTFPGACVPFGLVQASPDTGNFGWHHCSGYKFEDKSIIGFSQTHLNGTGWMDLGDAMLMPVRGDATRPCFPSSRKGSEFASPGYYRVQLVDANAEVEVTASEHVAFYSIRFRGPGMKRVLIDSQYGIVHREELVAQHVRAAEVGPLGNDSVGGSVTATHWVTRAYSFKTVFSRPWTSLERLPKRDEKEKADRYLATFDVPDDEPLLVKVALSAFGGVAGAERNLEAEIPDWDFKAVHETARAKWNVLFGRALVEGSEEQKRNFYTSLYHLFIQPNNLSDVRETPFYSTLSCWDTFRAAGPLYTILVPDRASEFVESMLEQGRRTGYLPIWTLWGRENQGMIGTHSIPMIVDAYLKGTGGPRGSEYWEKAYQQIKETLTKPHKERQKEDWDLYDKYGYYPFDVIKGESVSRTMECAYDDWCAGVMARQLGHKEDAVFFSRRAANWKKVFDPSIGFVRGKDTWGNWRTPYDPFAVGHGADRANDFTEGNAFQYTWHVMQDPRGIVAAMGGREVFVERLDALFRQPDTADARDVDLTGLVGQYIHGNEPSHHVIYFYPQVGHPERAAERIREVFDRFYLPKPDGLCGNDDCGQMSAWYLFSAMGFYPFNPCGGEYIIGAPQIQKVVLSLPNGKVFKMIAKGVSKKGKYVKSVILNGRPIINWKIRHKDIMNGGDLVFEMSDKAPENPL